MKVSNNIAKIQFITLKFFNNTLKRLKNYLYFEKNKLIKVYKNEKLVVGAVEITAQMPCSYSTLRCCSLVDLLPWECCRLHYGEVQSPQP